MMPSLVDWFAKFLTVKRVVGDLQIRAGACNVNLNLAGIYI
jgi:hypothetical protein